MFGIFKKKTEAEVLDKEYQKLLEAAFKLSTIDRKASDQKYAEADVILKKIENLRNL
jgi:hypothetical protein